ncbi:hypothetical protein SK128_006107 [Halocaridina rubra]|uniref:DNA-directed RNA polymerase I subunit RPA49 n=1 Tax=Halocaridina rubra TaxID=373956 RepID=A0AAN8WY53_HALRR
MAPETKQTSPSKSKKRKFVIESVIRKDKLLAEPVLARFLNGRPCKDGNLRGRLFQNNTNNLRYQNNRLFAVETPQLTYIGKNYGVENSAPIKELYFLGILDKKTGKMKLVEMSSYTLYPNLPTFIESEPDLPLEETYTEKQRKIISEFGSKKANKAYSQAQMVKVDPEGMAEAIHQASTSVEVTEDDLNHLITNEESYLALLPECDRNASTPEEVYKLEWIAPDDFLAHYETVGRQHLKSELKFDETYSSLMKVIAAIAKFELDDESQIRQVCLALYIEDLIRFSRLKSWELRKGTPVLQDCPERVKYYIFHTYTSERGKVFSATDKDRLLCCILVLSLIGCKYEVFTTTLIESLQMNIKKLNLLMKAIGATYMRESNCYKLKFPLTRLTKSYKKISRSMKKK